MKLSSGTKCRCTLGELIECFDNKRIPLSAQERATRKGPYRYYGAQNVVDHIDAYLFDGEYALIAEDGENLRSQKQDVAQIVEGQFWVNNHAHIIQANANADLWYLCALLNQTDISRYISGSAQPKLSQEGMRKIVVEVPDVQEQRRIGLLLRSLDRKIALNRKKIATLEKMAKEIYDYWFVQYDFPDANGRPYKSSGGEMVYSPELKRDIPKGWGVTKIADVLAKIPSTERVQTVNYADSGTIPIIDQSEKFIAGYTENNATALALKSCVVFGDHSCTVKYVNFRFARGADGTQILHSNTPLVDDTQLYFNLLEMDFDEGYKRHFSALKDKLIVISPNASLTATYTSVVDGLFAQIRVLRQKTNTISALRDFLLPLLMNGQVRIGGAAE